MYILTRKMFFLIAALVAVTSGWISAAAAQEVGFKCGATIESNVETSVDGRSFISTSFVQFTDIPFAITVGTIADCAVVLFTADTACKGASTDDTCYIRALDNGVPMRPGAGDVVLDSESQTLSAHALAFVKRGPLQGTHHFTIEVRVGKTGTALVIDNWTVHVQLFS